MERLGHAPRHRALPGAGAARNANEERLHGRVTGVKIDAAAGTRERVRVTIMYQRSAGRGTERNSPPGTRRSTAARAAGRALPSRGGGRYLLRMRMVPVFVNGARVESAERAPVIEAVRQWDASAARDVETGARALTDSRGLPMDPSAEVVAGTIVRVVGARERDNGEADLH